MIFNQSIGLDLLYWIYYIYWSVPGLGIKCHLGIIYCLSTRSMKWSKEYTFLSVDTWKWLFMNLLKQYFFYSISIQLQVIIQYLVSIFIEAPWPLIRMTNFLVSFFNVILEVNPCTSDPCENGATCRNDAGRYECVCVNGFEGDNCEIGRY